jgi:hypothetical protein
MTLTHKVLEWERRRCKRLGIRKANGHVITKLNRLQKASSQEKQKNEKR